MDITRVFGTWIWGSSPYETANKIELKENDIMNDKYHKWLH